MKKLITFICFAFLSIAAIAQQNVGDWRVWDYDPLNTTDCLPTARSAGAWGAWLADGDLIKMGDGKVLHYMDATGAWGLYNYDNTVGSPDCLGNAVASGNWAGVIQNGHELYPMSDGKVLDYVPASGAWKVWNYDGTPGTTDCLPTSNSNGNWGAFFSGMKFAVMPDGRVVAYSETSGDWRLWNYDGTPGSTDCLPNSVSQGNFGATWFTGRKLISMGDGKVLCHIPSTGQWNLYTYDNSSGATDFLPNGVSNGTWNSVQSGHKLITMSDGGVLDVMYGISTSVEDQSIQNGMTIYPNPASDLVTLSLDATRGNQSYEVVDLMGRTVMAGVIEGEKTTVDVRALPNGQYILNAAGKTRRLVVSK